MKAPNPFSLITAFGFLFMINSCIKPTDQKTINTPIPPKLVVSTLNESSIQVCWTPVESTAYYNVHSSLNPEFGYELMKGLVGEICCVDSGLGLGTAKYYKVESILNNGISLMSTHARGITAPSVPQGIVATSLSDSEIRIAWQSSWGDSVAHVLRARGLTGAFRPAGLVNGTEFLDAHLRENALYRYRLLFEKDGNLSDTSQTASAETFFSPSRIDSTKSVSNESNYLTWFKKPKFSTYEVYRKKEGTPLPFSRVAIVADTQYLDTDLDFGTEYVYKVKVADSTHVLFSQDTILSTKSDWSSVGPQGFSFRPVTFMQFCVDGAVLYALNKDKESKEFYVMKYDYQGDRKWSKIGNAVISNEYNAASIYAADGIPYIAYQDVSEDLRLSVCRYDSNAWTKLGAVPASAGQIYDVDIVAAGGKVYAGFNDSHSNMRLKVMAYIGGIWEQVGDLVSEGPVDNICLKENNGVICVAYRDSYNDGRATVKSYYGTVWTAVGQPGFSDGEVNYLNLEFNGGEIYVAYADRQHGLKGVLKRFDAETGEWANVGPPYFTLATANYISLSLLGSIPYVAFQNEAVGERATLMKFDSAWLTVGGVGITRDRADFTALRISDETAYLGFIDKDQNDRSSVLKIQ